MSKARGSSANRKASRLHIDTFQGRKFKRRNNRAGRYFQQHITDEFGKLIKTIQHRIDGEKLTMERMF